MRHSHDETFKKNNEWNKIKTSQANENGETLEQIHIERNSEGDLQSHNESESVGKNKKQSRWQTYTWILMNTNYMNNKNYTYKAKNIQLPNWK